MCAIRLSDSRTEFDPADSTHRDRVVAVIDKWASQVGVAFKEGQNKVVVLRELARASADVEPAMSSSCLLDRTISSAIECAGFRDPSIVTNGLTDVLATGIRSCSRFISPNVAFAPSKQLPQGRDYLSFFRPPKRLAGINRNVFLDRVEHGARLVDISMIEIFQVTAIDAVREMNYQVDRAMIERKPIDTCLALSKLRDLMPAELDSCGGFEFYSPTSGSILVLLSKESSAIRPTDQRVEFFRPKLSGSHCDIRIVQEMTNRNSQHGKAR